MLIKYIITLFQHRRKVYNIYIYPINFSCDNNGRGRPIHEREKVIDARGENALHTSLLNIGRLSQLLDNAVGNKPKTPSSATRSSGPRAFESFSFSKRCIQQHRTRRPQGHAGSIMWLLGGNVCCPELCVKPHIVVRTDLIRSIVFHTTHYVWRQATRTP